MILNPRNLLGVKQLQLSLQANAPMSNVPSAVGAGTPPIRLTELIDARTKQSIRTEICANGMSKEISA